MSKELSVFLTVLLILFIASCSSGSVDNVNPDHDHKGNGQDQDSSSELIDTGVFKKINLDYSGLEKVKNKYNKGDYKSAAKSLLEYYRSRTTVKLPKYNKADKFKYIGKTLSKGVQQKADSALKHIFFVHKGYGNNSDGYLHYGKDINWLYWPVHDNEIRWQVNRMKWWIPLGLAYWSTGEEKYAKEWMSEYLDWMKDNPLGVSNVIDRYAWRSLEVSRRLKDQTALFNMFISSPNFTPQFLLKFLGNYYRHEKRLQSHYSAIGNHLLFESMRMIYATTFFPEFKNSKKWQNQAVNTLTAEIQDQVYKDGMQFELSPKYHLASIMIFYRATKMARVNNLRNMFPQSYYSTLKKMIYALIDFSFPNYSYPMFGDTDFKTKRVLLRNYKSFSKLFPNDPVITYYATDGSQGHPPTYLSSKLSQAGFYTFRNGWKSNATALVLKAGPRAFFHNQPDNGTFNIWVKGRNYTPDTGYYVYSGGPKVEKKRKWYRQSWVHQTLTLNYKNINDDPHLLKWNTGNKLDILSYINKSYNNLSHRRTVIFVDNKFFIFVDEAIGKAKGKINLHFQLAPNSNPTINKQKDQVYTNYSDGNNLVIQSFSSSPMKLIKEEGKISYEYRQSQPRPAFSFQKMKNREDRITYITVFYPYKGNQPPMIKTHFTSNNDLENGHLRLIVNVNSKQYVITQNIK